MIIGTGSTASVSKCGKRYAVKDYGSKFDLAKVVREIHFLNHYKHPHIITLHKVYVKDGRLRLRMEYGGICLAKLRNPSQLGRLGINKTYLGDKALVLSAVIPQILSALDFLHTSGVCHRDVSPFNILCNISSPGESNVSSPGEIVAKLCDFGSALKTETYTRVIMNEYFDSPEKIKSAKSDIYSFGVSIAFYCTKSFTDIQISGMSVLEIIRRCLQSIESRPSAGDLLGSLGLGKKVSQPSLDTEIDTNGIDSKLMSVISRDDVCLNFNDFKVFKCIKKYVV